MLLFYLSDAPRAMSCIAASYSVSLHSYLMPPGHLVPWLHLTLFLSCECQVRFCSKSDKTVGFTADLHNDSGETTHRVLWPIWCPEGISWLFSYSVKFGQLRHVLYCIWWPKGMYLLHLPLFHIINYLMPPGHVMTVSYCFNLSDALRALCCIAPSYSVSILWMPS